MSYPFDYTGLAQTNSIINEKVSITISNGINAYIIVPQAAPFFGSSLVIVNENGDTLVKDVDYFLTHPWEQANVVTAAYIYGSITLLPTYNVGIYSLNYQTIGGDYVENKANIIETGLGTSAEEYLNIDWENAPTAFPPTPHTQELTSVNGMAKIIQSLDAIGNALRETNQLPMYDDIQDMVYMDIASTYNPLLNMVEAIGINSRELANIATDLLSTIDPNREVDENLIALNHVDGALPNGLKIKSGTLYINPRQPLDRIVFSEPFANKCFYIDVKCTCKNPLVLSEDVVLPGTPYKEGVRFRLNLDNRPNKLNLVRTITYFAIGV
jgi:hypothetical protein